jgi:hypothetical protein
MSAHTAGLRIPRRRVEHIQELTAEISARERVIVHLLVITTRATVYFFTFACLTAALITYINGKNSAALVWGGIGLSLVVLVAGVKGGALVLHRAIAAIREEIAEVHPGEATAEESLKPAPDPAEPPAAGPIAAPAEPGDDLSRS